VLGIFPLIDILFQVTELKIYLRWNFDSFLFVANNKDCMRSEDKEELGVKQSFGFTPYTIRLNDAATSSMGI
jgi:hypothetical protein